MFCFNLLQSGIVLVGMLFRFLESENTDHFKHPVMKMLRINYPKKISGKSYFC